MSLIRRAVLADAPGIAAVHVASWESTYADLLPVRYIQERTLAVRLGFWTDRLIEDDPAVCIFVACRDDETICGFASGGPERDRALGLDGELYSVYLLELDQGSGLGRQLVGRVLTTLQAPTIAVWVLEGNPACQFYERLGAVRRAERPLIPQGGQFTEIGYALPLTNVRWNAAQPLQQRQAHEEPLTGC